MKRLFILCAALILALSLCLLPSGKVALAAGYELQEDGTYKEVVYPPEAEGQPYRFNILEDGTAELVIHWDKRGYGSSVVIPSTVTYEGKTYTVTRMQGNILLVFDGITSLTLPDSLVAITSPLSLNNDLTEINVSPDHPVFEVVDGVLFDKTKHELLLFPGGVEATSYTVPEGTLSIAEDAFNGCDMDLTALTLPDSLNHIGPRALTASGYIKKIVISKEHPVFKLVDGVLFDKSGETLIFYPPQRKGSSYTVPKGTKVIADGAFCAATKLTSVKLPKGLTHIGNGAFESCCFKSITLPESLTHIGDRAFTSCYALKSISFPKKLESIGSEAFLGCEKITKLVIPDSVTHIGNGAFDCYNLKSITLSKGLTEIPERMLQFCANLESITIPEGVTRIGREAFYQCEKLKKVTLPESLLTIGYGAFEGCSALKEIILPKGLTLVGSHAFDGCANLKKVTVSGKETQFGAGVFIDCTSLKDLILPEGMEIPEAAMR